MKNLGSRLQSAVSGKNFPFQRYDVPKKNADMPTHKQAFKIRNIFQGKFFQDKKHFSAFI